MYDKHIFRPINHTGVKGYNHFRRQVHGKFVLNYNIQILKEVVTTSFSLDCGGYSEVSMNSDINSFFFWALNSFDTNNLKQKRISGFVERDNLYYRFKLIG